MRGLIMDKTKKLLTLYEISTILGVSSTTVVKYIKTGDLKAIRMGGGLYRISEENFETFLKNMEYKANNDSER
jgi:excisionase family DNA binding protein